MVSRDIGSETPCSSESLLSTGGSGNGMPNTPFCTHQKTNHNYNTYICCFENSGATSRNGYVSSDHLVPR